MQFFLDTLNSPLELQLGVIVKVTATLISRPLSKGSNCMSVIHPPKAHPNPLILV